MGKALQLEIQGSTNFVFDVEGEWTPSIEPVYQEAANPPELAELRHTWEFEGCRLAPSSATPTETLWDDIAAFLAYFEDRSAHPTYVRVVRDPDGDNVAEQTLGPSAYEQLRVELVEGQQDPQEPAASWVTTATWRIRVSAVRKFSDANGISNFSQTVSSTYDDAGLRVIEWRTRIVTAEGTSAISKAQTYAKIDITALAAGYGYATNGPNGIDYEVLDADEVDSRTPTIVEAVSRVKEWGVSIGASGGGVAPGSVDVETTTTITAEETRVERTAFARGVNAAQWVAGQKLSGDLAESMTSVRPSHREARGRWVRVTSRGSAAQQAATEIAITITGGRRMVSAVEIPNGFPAIVQQGAIMHLEAKVTIVVRRTGGTGLADELKFPGPLAAPWILDPSRTEEGEPEIDGDPAADQTQTKWVRTLTATYVAGSAPNTRPLAEQRDKPLVTSYLLDL